MSIPGVREALPVGSAGIAQEMTALADTAGLVCLAARGDLDVHESGGPASCVLVALDPTSLADLGTIRPDLPVAVVGHLFWPEH